MGLRMPRTLNKLSPLKVQKLGHKGLHSDGGGLYLRISKSGTKSWMFRFGDGGKLRDMGLGPVHTISLPRARELARECRELRLQGIDPITHRRASLAARKAADAKAITFKECATAFVASHEAGWGNASHRQQWTNTLAQYVYPTLGEQPVAAIDTTLVMKVLDPIWRTIPETASRVRGRIEAVLDWAKARGYRSGENAARWRGHLDHLLPARAKVQRIKHLTALPYDEIGAFMAALRQETSIAARALEFTILTAARTGEVLGATWDEIDLKAKIWIVPAERMKAGKTHRVALSAAAIAVLAGMQAIRQNEFIFPGQRGRLSHKAMQLVLRRMERRDTTVHGTRSSFRDFAAERTNFPREVAEAALAHAIPNAVEAAYRRGDLFEKRRKLMEAWADYCGKPSAGGKVVPIRR
jgi:integrase